MINLLQFLVMEIWFKETSRSKEFTMSKVSITIFSQLVNSVMRIWRLHFGNLRVLFEIFRETTYYPEVDIIKKTENQAKMTKLSMEWKRLCRIKAKVQKKAKVRVNTEESAVKPEPELKNTIGCNLNPSDGPGKPNSITMKTVKTKWALNQFQQPICVQLTKTVKTLKAQS
ncbi:hypothetical protein Tco_1504124 [Tanacetum coccineum]